MGRPIRCSVCGEWILGEPIISPEYHFEQFCSDECIAIKWINGVISEEEIDSFIVENGSNSPSTYGGGE